MIALLRYLFVEIALSRTPIALLSLVSGLARGVLVALINAAAAAIEGGRPTLYLLPFGLVLAIYLASGFYTRIQSQSLIEDMTERLRLRFSKRLLRVQSSYLIGRDTGKIYNTLTQEVSRVSDVSVQLLESLQAGVLLAFCIPYLIWLSPVGALATFCTVALGAVAYFIQDRRATALVNRARAFEAQFFDRVGDLLHGFKEIRLNRRRAADLGADVGHTVESAKALSIRAERMFSISFVTSQGFIFALLAFLVMLLPLTAGSDRTTVFQFLMVILFALSPLEMLLGSYPSIVRARVSLERIRKLERELDSVVESEPAPPALTHAGGFDTISLRDVTVRLKDPALVDDRGTDIEREAFVLGPIDLDLRRGEVVFISGGNGTGKTTLLSILCGLRAPDEGEILLDGTLVSEDSRPAYRNLFAGVFSDFHLFRKLYGLKDADPALLDALLVEFDLRQRTALEDNQFTTLQLSAGQKRRLALCVAMLENRPILVFDEFAADQDPHHRRMFYEELLPRLRAQGKTVVAVSHDEARYHLCDRRIELRSGRIVDTVQGKLTAS